MTGAAASGGASGGSGGGRAGGRAGLPPIVVNLNSSSSELKLLRVLQTLVNLSGKDAGGMRRENGGGREAFCLDCLLIRLSLCVIVHRFSFMYSQVSTYFPISFICRFPDDHFSNCVL